MARFVFAAVRPIQRLLAPPALLDYLAKMFLQRFGFILIALSVVALFFDLINESEKVLSADGATMASLVKYSILRLPHVISLMIPFTALLASLVTFATLNQHSEVTVMKASGLSAYRIVLPLVAAACFISVIHLFLNEMVKVKFNAELDYWREHGYVVPAPPRPEASSSRISLEEMSSGRSSSISTRPAAAPRSASAPAARCSLSQLATTPRRGIVQPGRAITTICARSVSSRQRCQPSSSSSASHPSTMQRLRSRPISSRSSSRLS